MKIIKGDNVLIISGKDKGKTGKITRAFPKEMKVLVEGVNMKKKHIRPKREGEKGQVVDIPAPLNSSNVKLICPKCGKATRIGYKIDKDQKVRVCRKCESSI